MTLENIVISIISIMIGPHFLLALLTRCFTHTWLSLLRLHPQVASLPADVADKILLSSHSTAEQSPPIFVDALL